MKKWIAIGFLSVLVIIMVLISGCIQDWNKYCTDRYPGTIYNSSSNLCDQVVTQTLYPTPTPTPAPTVARTQDPIIGVWRCSDSSGYDHRYRFNADHTFVQSFDWSGTGETDVYKGTWRSLGGNSYETIDTEFAYPETVIYSPSRNVIYSKETPTFVMSPYAGDVKAATKPTK